MEQRYKRDYQTFNLFLILALLTVLFVAGLKVVLFAPVHSGAPAMEDYSAQK
jgi:hypothetical protein